MHISEFDYNLPKELIAQFPCEKRDSSGMLLINRHNNTIEHKKFFDIIDCLDKNDVLVMNNTKVIPARLIGKKTTGATIEVFLLKNTSDKLWEALIKPSKRVKSGTIIKISSDIEAEVIERSENDKWIVELKHAGNIYDMLEKAGNIPLPPYIERSLTDEQLKNLDYERYQTVFAKTPGSVAAPTAGLHFTPETLEKLKQKGIEICYVTLNVGLGTFKPVKAENILEHNMDSEIYKISEHTAKTINNAKQQNKNIVAIGTTTVRTLETSYQKNGEIIAETNESRLFIYPGYKFKVIDKLVTNFHLPKSTLLMLTSAFAGKELVFEAYREAIERKYRFYSYGDCMLII
jgi:S-adenosylmethionine:tRNA ribosyltransferase-isomerase